MDCSEAKSLFNAFLDGDLSGTLAAELAAHKLQCAACRRELALLEVVGHVVATDTEVPQLSADFSERLIACATAPQSSTQRWRGRTLLLFATPFAAAACLMFSLMVFRAEPAPVEGQPPTRVLPFADRVDSPEEMLRQVEQVRRANPNSAELAALESALRERMSRFAAGTEESAALLENFGKMTIMEILESIQLERTQEHAGAPQPVSTSGVEHAPPVADL